MLIYDVCLLSTQLLVHKSRTGASMWFRWQQHLCHFVIQRAVKTWIGSSSEKLTSALQLRLHDIQQDLGILIQIIQGFAVSYLPKSVRMDAEGRKADCFSLFASFPAMENFFSTASILIDHVIGPYRMVISW